MNRDLDLKQQLQRELDEIFTHYTDGESIGSLTFWYDEYSASLEFSNWKYGEFPWGIQGTDNISLEKYDVFDEDDYTSFEKIVKEFFEALRSNSKFISLPIREGFRFVIASFEDSYSAVGEPVSGLEDSFSFTRKSAIDLSLKYTIKSIGQAQQSPLQKVNFSSAELSSIIQFFTEKHLKGDDFAYYAYDDMDLGLALTYLAKSEESAFYSLCERIVNESSFQSFPKRELVVFLLVLSADEFYANIYVRESNSLRKLDEENELHLLYSD